MAEPGEGPGPPPYLFLEQNKARRAEKHFWRLTQPSPPPPPTLSQSLEDLVPTLSEGLDSPLSINRSSTGRETI